LPRYFRDVVLEGHGAAYPLLLRADAGQDWQARQK
jgi:hypothetical protein